MTERSLEQLTHEQLIQTVTERLGGSESRDSEASLYVRNEDVPGVRIHPYPKQRRTTPERIELLPMRVPSLPEDVTYADFLRDPAELRAAV